MKKIFAFVFIFSEVVCSFGQATKFEIVFDRDGEDYARSVIQTVDSGYAITGSSTSYGSGSIDIFLLKLREDGSWEWNKYYDGGNVDWGYSVKQTPDSGYIISGFTNSYGSGGYDAYLIRTDKNGDALWTKTIGGTDWDFSYYVELTNDNGFIISGSSFQNAVENMFLVRLDSLGNIVWQKTYDGNEDGIFHCVRQCFDLGFIAVGEIQSEGNKNILLMKVASNGDSLWSHTFGNSLEDVGYFVEQTFDSGYILSGKFSDTLTGFYKIAVIKTDSLGNSNFQLGIDGDSANDVSYCVHQCPDSGYIVSGYTQSIGGGGKDYRLIKRKQDGSFDWGRSYGGTNDDESFNMQITSDHGFVLVGETYSYGTSTPNIYVLKTDSAGVSTANVIIGVPENNLQLQKNCSVYPNPTGGKFNVAIFISHEISVSKVQWLFTDILGQVFPFKIISHTSNGNYLSFQMDASSVSDGIYFLKLSTPEDEFFFKVIIDKN